MKSFNINIPDELNQSLVEAGQYLERPKSYIIRKALELYLRELQEDNQDAEIALMRTKKANRKFYTSEEVDAILEARKDV